MNAVSGENETTRVPNQVMNADLIGGTLGSHALYAAASRDLAKFIYL